MNQCLRESKWKCQTMYDHWFVSRQKRKLTDIPSSLIAFNDICVGKPWTIDNQLNLEDELQKRGITKHGTLRARRVGLGGGGTRTLMKQMKDLGLIFIEEEQRLIELTYVGEYLLLGKVNFVDTMRWQLLRYQYPSATSCKGSGAVSPKFKVHPFVFLLRVLCDPRLAENGISTEEIEKIVIIKGLNDSASCLEDVITTILDYRASGRLPYNPDDYKGTTKDSKTLWNIANTFVNYLELTQYIDRNGPILAVKPHYLPLLKNKLSANIPFIKNPEQEEVYLRNYGLPEGLAKDHRDFKKSKNLTAREIRETRIRTEYVQLSIKTPIPRITPDIIEYVVGRTGIDAKTVEDVLMRNFSKGNVSDFLATYRELANGRDTATDFEKATCELFRKIFGYKVEYVAPIGNTPDVYIESEENGYCAILDNKSYAKVYSITGDHSRRMIDIYIPKYRDDPKYPELAFFSYISGRFGTNIDSQIKAIYEKTGIPGSAISVDNLVDLATEYHEKGYNHLKMRDLFSLNRELHNADINV